MKRFPDHATIIMQHFRFFLILLFLLLVSCQPEGSFKPGRAQSAAGFEMGQPLSVSFAELDADPAAYVNRIIRVSGRYTPLPPPDCAPVRGPKLRWALIEEGLRLDASGFEGIILLLPEGTPMTVEGIWRHYQGPLGCGKEPPTGEAWYLQVTRLLQPNPLPLLDISQEASGGSPRMTLPPIEGGDATPSATPNPSSPTATATASEEVVETPTLTPTETMPAATVQPSETPSPTGTATATPTLGSATATPTPTTEPDPTRSGLRTPTIPPPTSTPGAYPVSTPGPSASSTVRPYP